MTIGSLRFHRWLLLLAGLALIAAAVIVFAAVTVFNIDPEDIRRLQGSAIGKAHKTASKDVVVRVNGYPITEADILQARDQAAISLSIMKDYELNVMPEDVRESGPRYFELVERHGTDAVALGGLIATSAYLSAAVDAGHSISDDDVAKGMEEYRRLLKKVAQGEPVEVRHDPGKTPTTAVIEPDGEFEELFAYIDAVGEDKYWTEILPAEFWRESTVASWRSAAARDIADPRPIVTVLYSLKRAAIADIDVKVVNGAFDLRTTPEKALAALYEFLDWEYRGSIAAPDMTNQTSTPSSSTPTP